MIVTAPIETFIPGILVVGSVQDVRLYSVSDIELIITVIISCFAEEQRPETFNCHGNG